MNINNPTSFSAPDLTLGLTNSPGSSGALRANDTILVYDTTLPTSISYGDSSSTGSTATAARRNHSHGMAAADNLPVATKAEMEAASIVTAAASPGRTQYHPGVSKAWGKVATAGTSFNAVYGFSGVSKPATGRRELTLSTAMTSVNWCAVTDVNSTGGGVYTQVDVTATTTVNIYIYNTSHAATDNSTMIACYGAQ